MGKAPKGTFQVVGNYRGRNFDANFHKGSGPANNNNSNRNSNNNSNCNSNHSSNNNSNHNSNHNSNRNSNHSSNHNSNNSNNNTRSHATAPTNKNPRSKRNLQGHEENTQYPAKGKARRTAGWDRPYTQPSPDHTTALSWPDPSISATHDTTNSRPSSIIADGSSSNSDLASTVNGRSDPAKPSQQSSNPFIFPFGQPSKFTANSKPSSIITDGSTSSPALTSTVYGLSDPAKPSQQSSTPFGFSFGQPSKLTALSNFNFYPKATVVSSSFSSVPSNAIAPNAFFPAVRPIVESLATSQTLMKELERMDGMRRVFGVYVSNGFGLQLMLEDLISGLNVILKRFDEILRQIESGKNTHWKGYTESIRKLRTLVWEEETFYKKLAKRLSGMSSDSAQTTYIDALQTLLSPSWSLRCMEMKTNSPVWEWVQERYDSACIYRRLGFTSTIPATDPTQAAPLAVKDAPHPDSSSKRKADLAENDDRPLSHGKQAIVERQEATPVNLETTMPHQDSVEPVDAATAIVLSAVHNSEHLTVKSSHHSDPVVAASAALEKTDQQQITTPEVSPLAPQHSSSTEPSLVASEAASSEVVQVADERAVNASSTEITPQRHGVTQHVNSEAEVKNEHESNKAAVASTEITGILSSAPSSSDATQSPKKSPSTGADPLCSGFSQSDSLHQPTSAEEQLSPVDSTGRKLDVAHELALFRKEVHELRTRTDQLMTLLQSETAQRRQAEQRLMEAQRETQDQEILALKRDLEAKRSEALTAMYKATAEQKEAYSIAAKAREERAEALYEAARADAERQKLAKKVLELEYRYSQSKTDSDRETLYNVDMVVPNKGRDHSMMNQFMPERSGSEGAVPSDDAEPAVS